MSIEESNYIATNESEITPQNSVDVPKTKKESPPTKKPLKQLNLTPVNDLIEYSKTIVAKYGLDEEKFLATIQNESIFNPYAVEPTKGLSIEIMQYVIDTWLAKCNNRDDRTDPYKAIDCAGRMWSDGHEYEWDAYCTHYYDLKCIKLRGIYPIK